MRVSRRTTWARTAGALLCATAFASPRAAAGEEARALAEASCKRAEQAARDLSFDEALAAYRAAMAADPSAPCARVARARADDLAAHSEGAFAPLARLESVRRDPKKTGDRAEIDALARDLEAFPPGRVRLEARVLVAESRWHALGDQDGAIAAFEAAVGDRSGDKLTRALALTDLCTLLKQRGELRRALAAVEREPGLTPELYADLKRLVLRERLRAVAFAVVGTLAAVGVVSLVRLAISARRAGLLRRVARPLPALFSAFLAGGGAYLAHRHGGSDMRPFLWLGAGVFALDVVARAFRLAIGGGSRAVRTGWAVACVAGVVCVAFLAAERTEPGYIEGIGL
jgi:hypothetical protein